MLAGSAYWETDRAKRKQYDGLVAEKQKKERHEAWLRELEIREEEEQELRALRDKLTKARTGERKQQHQHQHQQGFNQEERRLLEAKQGKGESGQGEQSREGGRLGEVRSALEESDRRRGGIFGAVMELWQSRR